MPVAPLDRGSSSIPPPDWPPHRIPHHRTASEFAQHLDRRARIPNSHHHLHRFRRTEIDAKW